MKNLILVVMFLLYHGSGHSHSSQVPRAKKYVYFVSYAPNKYYSKIYSTESYSKDKLHEFKNCVIEHVQTEAGRDEKVTCLEKVFDSYAKASEAWQDETGKRMFYDRMCDPLPAYKFEMIKDKKYE